MLIGFGPDIKSDSQESLTHIQNMAPTIMQALQLPFLPQFIGTTIPLFKSTSPLNTSQTQDEHQEIDELLNTSSDSM